jgi:exopolysaccharide biosynthesis WecB/TagA/CpsF family protein
MTQGPDQREVEFLGLRFTRFDLAAAHDWVLEQKDSTAFSYVVTPNVDHVVQLHRAARQTDDGRFWTAYVEADVRLCDSRILALLARRSGIDLPVAPGSDLTARLLSTPLPEGTQIALVGGDTTELAWLAAAQPGARLFHHRPPMGLRNDPAAQAEVVEFVEEARPHVTLLTVGAPQSELVAQLLKSRGKAQGVALCIGASLEFLAGRKRRAPHLVRSMNLEWAFRLFSEPQRLWRRYLVDDPAILRIWLRWRRQSSHDNAADRTGGNLCH